jgi:predicted HTH transcriptional regulator
VVVLVGWAWGVLEMNVVESERMTQNRVIALFRDEENAGDLGKMSGKMSGKIFELMRASPEITIAEIAVKLRRTERTIERLVRELREQEIIGRVGPAKGGHWEVLK